MKQMFLTAAEALGARHIKVGDFLTQITPMPRLIEAFAALCADAANYGTRILFELIVDGMIKTLPETLEMVEGAGAENGGIMIDLWHVVKMGIPYEDVARIPSRYLLGIELNDGTLECPWDLHEDTVNHRRFCGEGEFDVKGFVNRMLKAGYAGPWGIEVLSETCERSHWNTPRPTPLRPRWRNSAIRKGDNYPDRTPFVRQKAGDTGDRRPFEIESRSPVRL
jgi:sugar phosphate isomerase/epimerase